MRLQAAVVIVSMLISTVARADDKNDCEASHEQGQIARREGRFDAARTAFAACQADACPGVVRSRCAEFARELETAQPSIVVIVHDTSGTEIENATLGIDGTAPTDISGMGLRMNPGTHSLRVEADGFRTVERTITLPEGFKNMQVPFTLSRTDLPPTEATPTHASSPTAAWAFAIGSGVTLVAAGALSGAGWALHTSLKSSCGTSGCSESQVEPLRILWPASFVALGVATVSGVIATVLFATKPKDSAAAALLQMTSSEGMRF